MKPLVVVGAGPAGLAVAIAARQFGVPCTVVDKREPPFDKACGEGLMPRGLQVLAALGVTPTVAMPIVGIRYIDGATRVEGHFHSPGLGVRRTVLSEALLTRARAVGVDLQFGVTAQALRGSRLETSAGALDARLIVGADGLHSRVRELAGIDVVRSAFIRFGARQHYALAPWSRCVEVYWDDACEAYVTPVAADCVGVAVIAHGAELDFEAALRRFPGLAARLDGATVASKIRGAGPMKQTVRRRYDGHVALVGDSAGYVDACTGEGLSTGLACAWALAETVASDRPLAHYEDCYRRITRSYYQTTNLMLRIARKPRLRRSLIRLLARAPSVFEQIIAAHGSTAKTPLSRSSWSSISRLVGTT